jgi:hypothetical protein
MAMTGCTAVMLAGVPAGVSYLDSVGCLRRSTRLLEISGWRRLPGPMPIDPFDFSSLKGSSRRRSAHAGR